jgi:acetyl esterase/lipase
MPWLFLAASVVCLLLTANACWSARSHRLFIVPSFFAGWLVSEAPLHHFAAQLFVALGCAAYGGLAAWPGFVALALMLLSLAGLFQLYRDGHLAQHVVERALVAALGDDYRTRLRGDIELDSALPRGRSLVPVWLTDPRVRAIKNIAYADGGARRTLNLYLPHAPVRNAPVLVQIHGGGWSIGHKSQQGRPLVHYMAARGWLCVSINYRLSPRATWPAQLIDAKLALAWVKQHIAQYGGDPEFVVCTGGSAGGHLTAMLGLTGNDPRFQPEGVHTDTSVQAAMPLYAPYDFCNRAGLARHEGLRLLLERVVLKQKLGDARELYESGSPMGLVHAEAPPFFIVHGTHDSLACVEEARHFASELRAVSRSPVVYAELPRTQHAFEVFHSARTLHVTRALHRFAEAVYAEHLESRRARASVSYVGELKPREPAEECVQAG